MDVLVLSEFINTYSRNEFWIFEAKNNNKYRNNFKDFRRSPEFKPIAQAIADAVRRILKPCQLIDTSLPLADTELLMAEYAQGNADFNDQMIIHLCKVKDFKLVTDDGDFQSQDIDILTANNSLLK